MNINTSGLGSNFFFVSLKQSIYTYEDKKESACTNEEKKTLSNLASMFGGF